MLSNFILKVRLLLTRNWSLDRCLELMELVLFSEEFYNQAKLPHEDESSLHFVVILADDHAP